ncbi:MAG: nucleotidyltransferase family protein [Gammaproteobacteria bacterium]|nr:nucleotidyltransferase family protein [Gammaproteobacteria bacterium]
MGAPQPKSSGALIVFQGTINRNSLFYPPLPAQLWLPAQPREILYQASMQSRLGQRIEELVGALNRPGARFALIGGLALAPHGVIRATQDIDLLTDLADADAIDEELQRLGYRCRDRSEDGANYLRGDARVDF